MFYFGKIKLLKSVQFFFFYKRFIYFFIKVQLEIEFAVSNQTR